MASPPQPPFPVPYLHPPNLCFHVMDFAVFQQCICCFPHLFCQLELLLPQQDLMPSEKKGEGRRKLDPSDLPSAAHSLPVTGSLPIWILATSSSHILELLKPTSSQLLLVPETAETPFKHSSPSPGRLEAHLLVPGLVTAEEWEHGHSHKGLWHSGTYSASTRLFRSLSFSSVSLLCLSCISMDSFSAA